MIQFGEDKIIGVYFGDIPITSIYSGEDLVYKTGEQIKDYFEFEWDTDKGGQTAYLPIIPLKTGTADFLYGTVDWGDGQTTDYYHTSTQTLPYTSHKYSEAGVYTMRFTPDRDRSTAQIVINTNHYYNGSFQGITKILKGSDLPFTIDTESNYSYKPWNNISYVCPIKQLDSLRLTGIQAEELFFDKVLTALPDGYQASIQGDNLKRILGSPFKGVTNPNAFKSTFNGVSTLEYIEEICMDVVPYSPCLMLQGTKVHTIERVYLKLSNFREMFSLSSYSSYIRHMEIMDLGAWRPDSDVIDLSCLSSWGVDNTTCPNARQSLIDSLITNSKEIDWFGTIKLSSTTYRLLTDQEVMQIREKGWNIGT